MWETGLKQNQDIYVVTLLTIGDRNSIKISLMKHNKTRKEGSKERKGGFIISQHQKICCVSGF